MDTWRLSRTQTRDCGRWVWTHPVGKSWRMVCGQSRRVRTRAQSSQSWMAEIRGRGSPSITEHTWYDVSELLNSGFWWDLRVTPSLPCPSRQCQSVACPRWIPSPSAFSCSAAFACLCPLLSVPADVAVQDARDWWWSLASSVADGPRKPRISCGAWPARKQSLSREGSTTGLGTDAGAVWWRFPRVRQSLLLYSGWEGLQTLGNKCLPSTRCWRRIDTRNSSRRVSTMSRSSFHLSLSKKKEWRCSDTIYFKSGPEWYWIDWISEWSSSILNFKFDFLHWDHHF